MDFPSCVIGEQPELTSESLVIGDSAPYSWRNIFSCINLLRILNKLTKWKHSRIMMLVVFKSAPILKKTLKVRHAMMQLYVLKLLKMQTKYLGRQWRKSNMKTISAIYSKVRHRLNDDWAFGNDLDARPWDFQAEECTLRSCVDRFNNRRYLTNAGHNNNNSTSSSSSSQQNQSNGGGGGGVLSTASVLTGSNGGGATGGGLPRGSQAGQQQQQNNSDCDTSGYEAIDLMNINNSDGYIYNPGYGGWDQDVELSDEFKLNYELWLNQEVFNMDINWDSLALPLEW